MYTQNLADMCGHGDMARFIGLLNMCLDACIPIRRGADFELRKKSGYNVDDFMPGKSEKPISIANPMRKKT
jgi:hypothetical protein